MPRYIKALKMSVPTCAEIFKNVRKFIATIRACIARLIFIIHGLIAIWRVVDTKQEPIFWILSVALVGLIGECYLSIRYKGSTEFKWFSPVVLLYLLSVVPSVWFLELDLMEKRILNRENIRKTNMTHIIDEVENIEVNHTGIKIAGLDALGIPDLNFEIPIIMPASEWAKILEQLLMLILIVGRWLLPKGTLSRDQLSQLLLVNIGMAADIIELFEAFREETVKYNRVLTIIILGMWNLSLMQFTLVMTATKARRPRMVFTKRDSDGPSSDGCFCCETEIWAIMTCLLMQDIPFFCLRVTLIVHFHVVSYMNVFFTCKNTLVILLQFYRILVIHLDAWEKRKKRNKQLTSVQDLMNTGTNGGIYSRSRYIHEEV